MSDKYLKIGTLGIDEVEATATSAGVADAGKLIALNSSGKLDVTALPDGIGADTAVATAFESLSDGDLVNLFLDSTTIKVRKADASGGRAKSADGFVKSSYTTGASVTVFFDGTITGLTGLTIGARYFLSGTTAGAVATTIPTTSGFIMQYVGKAKSATELIFEAGEPIVRV